MEPSKRTAEQGEMSKYAAEGHAELDEVVELEPVYANRFDALTWDQRHMIALSVEIEAVDFLNAQHSGKETTFPTYRDTILAAAEGQLTQEEAA